MKFGTDYSMRQIKIPNETYLEIKYHCKAKKVSLVYFYEAMLDWFLQEHKNQDSLVYQASTKHQRTLSLWIKRQQIEKVNEMATRGKVSDARVIYTAMLLYLKKFPEFSGVV